MSKTALNTFPISGDRTMPLNAADAQILGDIINDLNPYYDANINTLTTTWQMALR
jgi:hypothetical protein